MGFSLIPKSISSAVSSVTSKFTDAAGDAKDAIADAAGTATDKAGEIAGDVFHKTAEVTKSAVSETVDVADYLIHHPPNPSQVGRTLEWIGRAIKSGESTPLYGDMPPYSQLNPADKAAAYKRGEGRTVPQPSISGDKEGTKLKEPVNLTVRGSKEDLIDALRGSGWNMAPALGLRNNLELAGKFFLGTEKDANGPVSLQYLNGQLPEMAFNKNDDYGAGRDHLRVYAGEPDPKTGEQTWQIAATRDLAATLTIPHPEWHGLLPEIELPHSSHRTDSEIDKERDLVMFDLLGTGQVKDWAAVKGDRGSDTGTKLPDGRIDLHGRQTDGYVYDLTLKPKPEAGTAVKGQAAAKRGE